MTANFTNLCLEALANLTSSNPSLLNDTTYQCDAAYSPNTPASAYIAVPLDVCLARMPGWQISDSNKLTQWAGPFVSFLVPALGFIFFIPREWNLTEPLRRFDNERKWYISLIVMAGSFVLFILDMLLGYAVVFAWAGSFIAGAVYEAFVDAAILSQVRRINREAKMQNRQVELAEWYAVAVTLVGSYGFNAPDEIQHHMLATMVLLELRGTRESHTFLRRLSSGVTSFATQVGIPMVFYLGSTLYGIIDGESRRGDNDTAHSIAFGLWYFVIVIVAIAGSLVLSVATPKALEAIFSDYHASHSAFKLRWLDERRMQLWRWSQLSIPGTGGSPDSILGPQYTDIFRRYVRRSCLIAGLILALPCVLAVVVSYSTPGKGWSCRSTTFLSYIAAQELLIVLWYFRSSPRLNQAKEVARVQLMNSDPGAYYRVVFWGLSTVSFLYHVVGALSVIITVGGTIMQLLGVYRNCICKAGLYWGLPTTRDWTGAEVKVSEDTQEDRDAADIWLVCGGIGVTAVAVICLFGAWHSMRMKLRCLHVIDELYWSEDVANGTNGNAEEDVTELSRLTVPIPESRITW